jgi:UDP-N-acetylmuramate dehydrogenase
LNEDFYQTLKDILRDEQILIEEPLAKHTTFQIGGPAEFLLLPENSHQAAELVKMLCEKNMPFYVIGNGSNLLVSDKGYKGTIIKIGQCMSDIEIEKHDESRWLVKAGAGVLLSKLANKIADHELTGFEFASGIPGSLGGAVTMNAGAYGGEMKDSIMGATVVDQSGNIMHLNKEDLQLGYRKSIIQEKNYIVLDASFLFELGNKEDIRNKMNDLNERRRDKQPLEYPSAGSTFKRPEGYFAGKLIMDAGLRGYQVGNAQISEKHCGFVINKGGATAADIMTLITEVRQIVFDKFGVMLEPEVRLLGEF